MKTTLLSLLVRGVALLERSITGSTTRAKNMTVDVSKIAASSYIMGLEQLSTTKTNTLAIGGQTLAASGNATYTLSVTAPVAKSFALGRIKFVGLTASNPADIGNVWYPVE